MTGRLRRVVAVLSTVTAVATVAVAVASASPASARAATLHWKPCHRSLFCARYEVPLDYDNPGGAQVSIALVKQPARDPAHRIGSLFVNPGGPGGSGVDFVVGEGSALFTGAVRARFDIIGFDPRGIYRSTQLRCFGSEAAAYATVHHSPYPSSGERRAKWLARDRALDSACRSRGSAILDHMATADVARDLDRLRQAVGDRRLNYYGVSYGSFLGDTYANMFPGRVRSVAIDGVPDPVAWTTGRGHAATLPFSTRLHSADGAGKTLHQFFRLCNAGGPTCPFGPHAASRYWKLYRSLRAHPLHIRGLSAPYDQTFLVGDSLEAMYSSADWPGFARYLVSLEHRANPSVLARARSASLGYYVNDAEGFPGVACTDSINPGSTAAWTRAASRARSEDGIFGPVWTWSTSACAHWPGHDADRYLGPFTHHTANPVLVVGNRFDPATPYRGAVAAARLLPNSRLLTVHAWGHTSLFLSTCADKAIGHYLLTAQPPARGKVCQQDVVPFRESPSLTINSSVVGSTAQARFPSW
jgi:pimeloyl-ACP methyl ester carboxylesterase